MRVTFVYCQIHQRVPDQSYPKMNTCVYYDFSIEYLTGTIFNFSLPIDFRVSKINLCFQRITNICASSNIFLPYKLLRCNYHVEVLYDDALDFSNNQRVHFVNYNFACSNSITAKKLLFKW